MNLALAFLAALLFVPQAAPDAKTQAEYQALIKQLDLETHPERHAQAAAWCLSKKWKAKADFHDIEARRHQYRKESDRLKPERSASDLKRLAELALKLKLEAESKEAREAWLAAELQERRAKLKADDLPGLKTLVAWAAKEGAGKIAAPLAEELLKLDPAHELAHLILGHLKRGTEWFDPWQLLESKGGLKDAKVRAELHRELAGLRKKTVKAYDPNPLASFERVQKGGFPTVWKDRIRAGDGRGTQYVWAPPNYTPAKAYPLILELHGGGNGGVAVAEDQAFIGAHVVPQHAQNAELVVVAPWARNHVGDSWKFRENALDAVDAVIDACERFNIDRRRIYLAGGSMGGQGVQVISWHIPELFPAFCPQTGYYLNDRPVPDLTGKHYLVFHGGKDTVVGQKTHPTFLEKIKAAGATAEFVFWPEEDHFLPHEKVVPKMVEFFKQYALDYEPDLQLVRRIVETLPWKTPPSEPVARPPAAPPPAAPPRGTTGADTSAPPPVSAGAIDLLEKADPARDAIAGTWRLDGKALVSPDVEFARLQVATPVPEEYDLEVVAERTPAASPEAFVIGLVGGGSSFMVGLDGWKGTKSGLEAIDGKPYGGNETTREGAVLAGDKPSTILCAVRKDRVTVSVDGKAVFDWKADYPRLSLRSAWSTRDGKSLFLGSYKCAYRITKWVLRPASAK